MVLHQSKEVIAQRYRILNTLGQGGMGITYEAVDLESGQLVALKALSLRRMKDWKTLELFEREAAILSGLNHPAIPCYLDYFQIDYFDDRCFYIVQQLAKGKSLATLVEKGWRPNESQVKNFAIQILEILVYLQESIPPVIHRDLKPQNIIRSGNGKLFLVDFGAVRDTYHNTITGGSTVVGTFGYMAPEQFRGQAILSTDLYGLGATLLFLLTGKSPADLPQHKLKINFRSRVRVSEDFASWLERMIEPGTEDRLRSAKDALAVLQGEQMLINSLTQKLGKPRYSPITLTKIEERLVVDIPPVWLRSRHSLLFGLISTIGTGAVSLTLFGYLIMMYWTASGGFPNFILNLHWLISFIILWPYHVILAFNPALNNGATHWLVFGIIAFITFATINASYRYFSKSWWYLGKFAIAACSRIKVEINQHDFRIKRSFLGLLNWKFYRHIQGIEGIELQEVERLKNSKIYPFCKTFCVVKPKLDNPDIPGLFGTQTNCFGFFLTRAEKEWLVGEIRAFLEELPSSTLQVNS